ncbi:MAG: hypothetical protein NTU59_01845, partial [Coprothermobacterota bacterium]|nr:hypothetical protein [Coprothermobacterota bacterium]
MKRITVLLLLLLGMGLLIGLPVRGNDVSDLQAELDEYKAQLGVVEAQLTATQDHQSELLNQIDDVNAQMYEVEGLFTFYQSKSD